jgi:hypothetical protein
MRRLRGSVGGVAAEARAVAGYLVGACMKQPTKHHLVDFAARHAGTRFKSLNVSSALWRAEALVRDAEELVELKKAAEDKSSFGIWGSTHEIISYFAVGFVTCLEWHARSRLVDLMLYKPSCITTRDLEGIAKVALSQMLAERVTVPHLLGAATNVSSVTEYIAVFSRVFEVLDIKVHVERELRNVQGDIELYREDEDRSLYSVIEELFESQSTRPRDCRSAFFIEGDVELRPRSCLRERDYFSHQVVRRPHHQICAAGLSEPSNAGGRRRR